jgi:hypothetical protein
MKIVLATPLYPPDIGETAAYAKEAAKRLAEKHDVTVVAYGRLPEKVPGVKILTISKRQPLFVRLFKYCILLVREARKADLIYAQNGASVELPAVFATIVTRTPLMFHIADAPAHGRAQKSTILSFIQNTAYSHASSVLADMPRLRPEILPFEPAPENAMSKYESSWREHLARFEHMLRHE